MKPNDRSRAILLAGYLCGITEGLVESFLLGDKRVKEKVCKATDELIRIITEDDDLILMMKTLTEDESNEPKEALKREHGVVGYQPPTW